MRMELYVYKFHRHQIFAKVHVYNVHVMILILLFLVVLGGWVCVWGEGGGGGLLFCSCMFCLRVCFFHVLSVCGVTPKYE